MGPRRPLDLGELDTPTELRCIRCQERFGRVADYIAHPCSRPVAHLTDAASVAVFAAHVLEACDKSPAVALSAGVAPGRSSAPLNAARPSVPGPATTTPGGAT